MDTRRLRYFVAVVEEQNIGRAAIKLNMSQPPLTRQIQELESEIGVQLLHRTPKGVEATNAGLLLFHEARNILSLLRSVEDRTRLAGQGRLGKIAIGIFGSNVLSVPPLLFSFRQQHPDVDVVVHTMDKVEQINALRERRLLIGFNLLGVQLDDIASEAIIQERLITALRLDHPLAQKKALTLRELSGHPLVVYSSGPRPNLIDIVFGLFRKANVQPGVVHEVVDSLTAVALVAAGFGVCLVPEAVSQLKLPGITYLPLASSPSPTVDLHAIYRRDDSSALLQAFLTTVKEVSANSSEHEPLDPPIST
ncbi:MAG TPA: LysR family transcriptional regulator [Eoetvoesiella sp.]